MSDKKYGTGFRILGEDLEKEDLMMRWYQQLIKTLKESAKEHDITHPEITITGVVYEKDERPEKTMKENEEYCNCGNYKWLCKELESEASFLFVHGIKIENRGPFKFCPYCGLRVKEGK